MEMNVKRKLNESQFYICLYGREGDRWGENESTILSFWGLDQKVFTFPPIHLNGRPRNPIYHLLVYDADLCGVVWLCLSNRHGMDL